MAQRKDLNVGALTLPAAKLELVFTTTVDFRETSSNLKEIA
jgi:hypothetical protein